MQPLFREKFEVCENKFKPEIPKESYKQTGKKWDINISVGFGLFAFFTLVGFVTSDNLDIKMFSNVEDHKCALETDNCRLICANINEDVKSIADYINIELQNETCNSKITLKITKTIFNNSKLSPGWLAEVKPLVTELIIDNCTIGLNEIEDDAFTGHPFQTLQRLGIVDVNVQLLRHQYFRGLKSVLDFSFFNYKIHEKIQIEEGALGDMSKTLKILELTNYIMSAEDIINLTGKRAAPLPKLESLVLNYNSIRELTELAFSATPNLKQLSLIATGLEKIDKNAFVGLPLLKRLYLSSNNLQTLPEGTFDGLTPSSGGIELAGNNWHCDCSLQWLQNYYMNNSFINKKKPPKCKLENGEEKNFDEVEFCPH